jgi:REP element-mobilizing transposase RayT
MRRAYTQLFIHLVWATWNRLPLITPALEQQLYRALAKKCWDLYCVPLAVGGMVDHVHVLVQMSPAVAVAQLVKELKGSSSHLITHVSAPGSFFKWQGAYGAVTVDPKAVSLVAHYIVQQKQHHDGDSVRNEWELSATIPPARQA